MDNNIMDNEEVFWQPEEGTPYESFGAECESGWAKLYQPLIDYVNAYNKLHSPGSSIEIHQIKEKFGGLRFYWAADNVSTDTIDEFRKMVEDAEAQSWTVCEECGSEEEVGTLHIGWFYTRCRECARKIVEGIGEDGKWKIGGKIYTMDKDGNIK